MSVLSDSQRSLIDDLFKIGVFMFGKFTLKSGLLSPVYVDLRLIVSYPTILRRIADEIEERSKTEGITCDRVCGVPYAALPVATCYSTSRNVPMVIIRKEAKKYGTGKRIEGVYSAGEKCLVIEDTVTYGDSVVDITKVLRSHELVVEDVLVILDRNQGGMQNAASHGLKLHSIFALRDVIDYLRHTKCISDQKANESLDFLQANQTAPEINGSAADLISKLSGFSSRQIKHSRAQTLRDIIKRKKSNLCLSADLTDADAILDLVKRVGSKICLLKLHSDAISNFSQRFITELKICAENLDFLILEDRKFGDIGNTVKLQLTDGMTQISSWAHFVTVHAVAGAGTFLGLKEVCLDKNIGCLIVAEMSSVDSLCNKQDYRLGCMELAKQHSDIVAGFICQKRLPSDNDSFLFMTPGVNFCRSGDSMKQQWREPTKAVVEDGNDVVIVGRGIYGVQQDQQLAAAQQFMQSAWEALQTRDTTAS